MILMPRDRMPQVCDSDLPALFAFAEAQGVRILSCNLPVGLLRRFQAVDPAMVARISDELLLKPLLTTRDNFILDGDHRHAAHELKGNKTAPCNVVLLDWNEALAFMLSFPKVFEYGDGKSHAVAN